MSEPISKDMQEKIGDSSSSSNWVKIKDENNKIIIDENNPFVGRLLQHEYIEADNPRYGNDEGMKHVLTWLTRENGEKVEKKQSTSSNWFMQKLLGAQKQGDTWDFKWWYEQAGPKKTIPHVEPYEKEEETKQEEQSSSPQDFKGGKDPRETDENEVEEVNLDDIPF